MACSIKSIVKAVRDGGVEVARVEVNPDGKVVVFAGKLPDAEVTSLAHTPEDELERWREKTAR